MNNLMNCNGIFFTPIHPTLVKLYPMSGVYMFCRRELNGSVSILYIGEAEDFSRRLTLSHEHWNEAISIGMNEIHLHFLAGTKEERLRIETYLRNSYPTPINRQSNVLARLS